MLNFIGIGSQKSGTTWLYKMLATHQRIAFPEGKEVHFWNRKFSGGNANEYFNLFKNPILSEGDITPAYGFIEPEKINVIFNHASHLKLIFILRNPIERAWSSALMALGRAEMELGEASDRWYIDHFNSKGSLLRGDYETCLKNWTSIFPKNQLLLLRYEDISKQPAKLLQSCCDHLNIERFTNEQLETMQIQSSIFPNKKHPMNSRLKQELTHLYQKKILSLESYLKQDLKHWL